MVDNQRAMELYRAKLSDYAIARELDTEPGVIWAWRKRRGLPANHPGFGVRREKQERKPTQEAKPARKRNPCQGCAYWYRVNGQAAGKFGFCEYILVTGHRRPCPPGEDCTEKCASVSAGRRYHGQEAYTGV